MKREAEAVFSLKKKKKKEQQKTFIFHLVFLLEV